MTLNTGAVPDEIEISADEEGKVTKFRVNDFRYQDQEPSFWLRITRGLVPRLELTLGKDGLDSESPAVEPMNNPFDNALLKATDNYFHGKTSPETRFALFNEIQIGSHQMMLDLMRQSG